MPLPFLFGAAAIVVGAMGVVGMVDANDTLKEAKRIRADAIRKYKRSEHALEEAKKSTYATIDELGKLKIDVIHGSVKNFVTFCRQIKNIKETEVVLGTETININSKAIAIMSSDFNVMNKVASGVLSGSIAGGASSLGAMGLASLVGTASTGTAISSLSGAAATNATLAWLGGGSLAAGGFGMTGGAVVLGGLILGPGLLISGFLMSEKADKAKAEVDIFASKVKVRVAETESIRVVLRTITKRGEQIIQILQKLDRELNKISKEVDKIILKRGTNWDHYNKEEKTRIMAGIMLVKTCKVIFNTSLINEKGNLTKESKSILVSQDIIGLLEEGK